MADQTPQLAVAASDRSSPDALGAAARAPGDPTFHLPCSRMMVHNCRRPGASWFVGRANRYATAAIVEASAACAAATMTV